MTTTPPPPARAIYLPSELASYFRAASPIDAWAPSTAQVFGWIRRGLLAPGFRQAPGSSIVADFDDVVTGQAISLLRAAGIPLRGIDRAELYFADLYGVERPFAHRSFWTSGRDIFGKLDDLLIAGTRGGQIALPFMLEQPCPVEANITFDGASGRPVAWLPVTGVELRPAVQCGQPCVAGTPIPTATIERYTRRGDPLSSVARHFGVRESDVQAVIAWELARAPRMAAVRST
jgi:uncharacterized protein (DUF433 family)